MDIEPEGLIQGTGDKALCPECTELNQAQRPHFLSRLFARKS